MTGAELLAFLLTKENRACEEGLGWLRERIAIVPGIRFADLWEECLALNVRCGGVPETHVGHAWLAWICRHAALVPCGTGTYSGRRKVYDGPHVTDIDPATVEAALRWEAA